MAASHHPNYTRIYFILLALLVVSVTGPVFEIKWVTLITAFGVAIVKANLVVQNFMHLRWEKRLMKWMLSATLLLMFLLFYGVAPDVMKHSGRNWVNESALEATARGIGGGHGDEKAATETASEPAFDARAAYNGVCSSCHGQSGAGDGPAAAALSPRPADFREASFWAGRTDESLVRVIREGGAAVGKSPLMPAWGGLYDEAQALALVEYLRTLRAR